MRGTRALTGRLLRKTCGSHPRLNTWLPEPDRRCVCRLTSWARGGSWSDPADSRQPVTEVGVGLSGAWRVDPAPQGAVGGVDAQ